jgi:hypothetical protein
MKRRLPLALAILILIPIVVVIRSKQAKVSDEPGLRETYGLTNRSHGF